VPNTSTLFLLVRLQQGRAGEADEQGIRQDRFHGFVQLAGLGAVALVHKYKQIAFGCESLWAALAFDLRFDKIVVSSLSSRPSEFVDQRA
jgi:hypothetical protein